MAQSNSELLFLQQELRINSRPRAFKIKVLLHIVYKIFINVHFNFQFHNFQFNNFLVYFQVNSQLDNNEFHTHENICLWNVGFLRPFYMLNNNLYPKSWSHHRIQRADVARHSQTSKIGPIWAVLEVWPCLAKSALWRTWGHELFGYKLFFYI